MKISWISTFLFLIAASLRLMAQDLPSVAAGVSADLSKALADLAALQQRIESERMPLARSLAELEQRVAERRGSVAKAQRSQENRLVELNALKADARRRVDETKQIDALLAEYSKAFRARLGIAEEPLYSAMLEGVEKAGVTADLPLAAVFEQRSVLLSTALERLEKLLGGEALEARALDEAGQVRRGKAVLLGPVAVFASAEGGPAGLLHQELNRADPSIFSADPGAVAGARALVSTGTGELLLDPTLGNAFKLASLDESLYEELAKGGMIMIPLLLMGAAALVLGCAKWIQLARIRLASERDLQLVLRNLETGEAAKALACARGIAGPAGELLAAAVEHAGEKKEFIEEVLYEKMLGARTRLERGIAFLSLAATTGPLMGLLGTVMGMISTFKLISGFGGGDPKALAAGISEALVCTATGMAVAIPSLLFHAFLSRKAKGIIGSMEQTAVGFINGVPEQQTNSYS